MIAATTAAAQQPSLPEVLRLRLPVFWLIILSEAKNPRISPLLLFVFAIILSGAKNQLPVLAAACLHRQAPTQIKLVILSED